MQIIIDIDEDFYELIKYSVNIKHSNFKPFKIIANGTPLSNRRLPNSVWIDFLTEQFDISRTSAKEMLHTMMSAKKEDNFKKQFSGRK